jgi:hypothetical protein
MAATRSKPVGTAAANGAVAKTGGAVTAAARRAPAGARCRRGGSRPGRRIGARRVVTATGQGSRTAIDIQAIRQQLEQANRRSPVEILLDGLTHRRGAHKLES